jgi:hypothetical protein
MASKKTVTLHNPEALGGERLHESQELTPARGRPSAPLR